MDIGGGVTKYVESVIECGSGYYQISRKSRDLLKWLTKRETIRWKIFSVCQPFCDLFCALLSPLSVKLMLKKTI